MSVIIGNSNLIFHACQTLSDIKAVGNYFAFRQLVQWLTEVAELKILESSKGNMSYQSDYKPIYSMFTRAALLCTCHSISCLNAISC